MAEKASPKKERSDLGKRKTASRVDFAPAHPFESHASAVRSTLLAVAMLLYTNRLQRPSALKTAKYVLQKVTVTGKRTYSNAFTTRSSWICTQIRLCQSTMSCHLGDANRGTKVFWRKYQTNSVRYSHSASRLPNKALIALGSNMGDRVAMIEQACRKMESTGLVKILRTSNLYETKAMYVLDQDNFVNGACEVHHTFPCQEQSLKSAGSNFITTTGTPRLSSICREQHGPCQGH